jgi:RNA polymerase sigma-70 factor, ECF subfamily
MDLQSSEDELRRLMVESLDGDHAAHRELLTRLSARLRAFFKVRLTRIGRSVVDAEDLVQETLIAVHTRRHTYDRSQPFTPWLYAIGRYKLLDHLRRTKTSLQEDALDQADEVVARDDYAAVESALDVRQLIQRLPVKARRAIERVKLQGLSVSETAARSGASQSAVKVSVHRGLKTLARFIRKESRR